MNIFIYEDDQIQRQYLTLLIQDIALNLDFCINKLIATDDPNLIIREAIDEKTANIYFLDIEINNSLFNGFELAKKIRKRSKTALIVFITNHPEYGMISFEYKVAAIEFISKYLSEPIIKQKIKEILLLAQSSEVEETNDIFSFENQFSSFKIEFQEILFFQTIYNSHKIQLVCKSKIIDFYSNLKTIETLDNRFFRCHRSIVINMDNVIEIDKKMSEAILIKNKFYSSCPIARRLSTKMGNKFLSKE